MANAVREQLRGYAQLIESRMPSSPPFSPELEDAGTIQVERGTIYPLCLQNPAAPMDVDRVERLIELASSERLASLRIVDCAGHQRSAYRGLLVYCWLQAYRLAYESLARAQFGRWEEALRTWSDLLEAELTQIDWPAGPLPAIRGDDASEAAWAALALHVAGKAFIRDAWIDLASDTFGRLARAQQPQGPFLLSGASDSPDAGAFHELVLLHAAASYAVQAEDRTIAAAVARATEYHQRETQPDHATAQPWALFAFIWNAQTRPLAEQILHASEVQHPEAQDGVTFMLLADALYCLRLFDCPPETDASRARHE